MKNAHKQSPPSTQEATRSSTDSTETTLPGDNPPSPLSQEHFERILDLVREQVFNGKGKERHGHEKKLEHQPWVHITQNVGKGFCIGQAMKKLMELRTFDTPDVIATDDLGRYMYGSHQPVAQQERWMREAIGAVVYIIFAMMWKETHG